MRLGLAIGAAMGEVAPADVAEMERGFAAAPAACRATIELEPRLARMAQTLTHENEALFIGRGWAAAMAAEAALKLKELSYLRAEAYAAGELKHGPIALIREGSPVLMLAPADRLLAKTVASAEEVAARGAAVTVLTDRLGGIAFAGVADAVVLPGEGVAHVFAQAVAVQLIAYHAALILGRNVDRPRNLAKSVTVE
jgi:glucosamine--fructose-6-phosphate aminotransferase (isomerizing)